jgi:hypothetical protein
LLLCGRWQARRYHGNDARKKTEPSASVEVHRVVLR